MGAGQTTSSTMGTTISCIVNSEK